ncbi:hypothetical protein JZU46_04740 [bacterium]|nr:hypothetical protein [bacterium]
MKNAMRKMKLSLPILVALFLSPLGCITSSCAQASTREIFYDNGQVKEKFYLDEKEQILKVEDYDSNGKLEKIWHYIYDGNGKLIKREAYSPDGKLLQRNNED